MVREPVSTRDERMSKAASETEKPEQPEEAGDEEEGGEEEEEGEEEEMKARKAAPPGQMPPPQPPANQAPPLPPGRGGQVAKPGQVAKGDLSEADLLKSLSALQQIADNGTPASRKDTLLEKAKSSQLNKSETDELFGLMGGGNAQPPATLSGTVTAGLQTNDTIQKAIDVSDYLASHQEEMVKSLDALAKAVESQDRRQHEFNLVLAKATCDMGSVIRAIGDRVGAMESQPAHAPKSVAAARALSKSFMGQAPVEDAARMSRGDVLQMMTNMMEKSMQDGAGGIAPCGEDLLGAVAKYEQTGLISKALHENVIEFRKSRSA